MSRDPNSGGTAATCLLHVAVAEPLAPAWSVIEGVMALLVEHLADGAGATAFIELDDSLWAACGALAG